MAKEPEEFGPLEIPDETEEVTVTSSRIGLLEGRVLLVVGMTLLISVLMLLLLFGGADGFRPGTGTYPPKPTETDLPGTDTGNTPDSETADPNAHETGIPVVTQYPYATVSSRETVLPLIGENLPENGAVVSDSYILVRVSDLAALSGKDPQKRMDPASMTKVMTLLVLCDHITSLTETVTIPKTLLNDPLLAQNVQIIMDFIHDDHPSKDLSVEVLLYMIGVESSADAVLALTRHVAGDDATFVRMMNEKAAELGLTDTHFTNAIGLKQPDHYSTVADMAAILIYALQNPLCRQILETVSYRYFDEGAGLRETLYSTLFVDRMEKKGLSPKISGGITIKGGKTGSESYFTVSNGVTTLIYTLMTYASDADGNLYVAVTSMNIPYDSVPEPLAQTVKDALALYKSILQ